jgi:hypothetical protein
VFRQRVDGKAGIGGGVAVSIVDGPSPAIDTLAAGAEATHGFLRAAWYAGSGAAGMRTMVAAGADGTPLIAIPTMRIGPALLGMRAVPGSYWPFRSLAIAPGATLEALTAILAAPAVEAALGTTWRLGPVYEDDPAITLLGRAAKCAGWTAIRRTHGPTYLLDLAARPPRADRRVAGYARSLAEGGMVELRTVTGDGWTEAAIADLAHVERNSWVGQATDGSGAKFIAAAEAARWYRVTRDPFLAAALSATILSVAGEPIAFSFDLAAGPTQYAIASSFHQKFAKARPGRIVTADQFARAAAAGITTIDLGAGDSGYKRAMGAVAGPALVDILFVRNRAAAELVGWHWGTVPPLGGDILRTPPLALTTQDVSPRRLRDLMPPLLAAGALAAAAMSIAE